MSRKITLIGAGSVVFAKTLLGDILQFPELADSTICLMDIDADRLKVAKVMVEKMIAKLKIPARLEATNNQKEAIRGAKYVICTIQVGGYKPSTLRDFDIPRKYGLEQTIADTLGVGGVFRGLRTIPVINSIAQDIADLAHPDCLFLNYTNPMAMNCWAVAEGVGIPHVGLCHSVFGTARMLANHAGLPFEDVSYLVAGVNHMAFFLKFQYRGQDAYPLLFKLLEDPERNYEKVRFEMMRRTGYFVTESSEHQSEYVPYFIHHGKELIDKFDIPIDEYIRRCDSIIDTWQKTEANLLGEGGEIDITGQSHEYGSYIIHSRETNQARTVYGNVPNDGLIDNLTPGCCVEVPCLVDATGLNPVHIGKLPEQLAALCMTNVNVQRLTVNAALTNKREYIYHAVMMDPHTSATLPLDKIWAMCDELIEAHQKDGYLGEFSPTLKNTGRGAAGISEQMFARVDTQGCRLEEPGKAFEVTVSVENPSQFDQTSPFEISASNHAVAFDDPTHFTLAIPAGEIVTHTLKAHIQENKEAGVRIKLHSDDPHVLAIDKSILPREALPLNDAGESEFSIKLNGFDAVQGRMKQDGEMLNIDYRIMDSDIKMTPDRPWQGSCLELFFAKEDGSDIHQLFSLPLDNGRILDSHHKDVEGAQMSLERTKIDYEMSLRLPLAKAGIRPGERFLFSAIAKLGALGDAHSGGRCSLSGRMDNNFNSEHFHAVNS